MFCSKCGAQIKDESKFCPKCGEKVGGKIDINFSSIDINGISEKAKGLVNTAKANTLSKSGLISENLILYIVGGVSLLFQMILYLTPLYKIDAFLYKKSMTIFEFIKGDSSSSAASSFLKAFIIILYIMAIVSYVIPLVSKKAKTEKAFVIPIIASVISLIIFIGLTLIVYIGSSDTDFGDVSDMISIKAGGWFYVIFNIATIVCNVLMKKKAK